VLQKRINQDPRTFASRPTLTGKGTVEELEEIMVFRDPYYEKAAKIQVDTSSMNVEAIVENILAVLKKRRGGFEMGGNSFGTLFRVTTWENLMEKHLGGDRWLPTQIELSEEYIQREMDKRRPGQSFGSSPREERDQIKILSGVFEGKTTARPFPSSYGMKMWTQPPTMKSKIFLDRAG